MEKATRPKKAHKMLSFLPKAATVPFPSNHPFSPGAQNPSKSKASCTGSRGFSGGQNASMIIPAGARMKSKSSGTTTFDAAREPTSPKISCMGQIKHSKNSKMVMSPQEISKKKSSKTSKPITGSSSIRKIMFGGKKSPPHHVPAERYIQETAADINRAPGLSQMKRFASSGDNKLKDFDWKYYLEDDQVIIPHSAPRSVSVGAQMEPVRKEINLWKRRTMEPPKALRVIGIGKPFK